MATYKPSALFEQFRGKIGNSVFTANRAGNNLRTYVVPSNPQTANQVKIRDIFAAVASLWFSLSTAARSAWVTFANNGYIPLYRNPNTLGFTGRQAFSALKTCCDYAIDFIGTHVLLTNTNVDWAGDDLSDLLVAAPAAGDDPPALWAPSLQFETHEGMANLLDFGLVQANLPNGSMTYSLSLTFDALNNDAGTVSIMNDGSSVGFSLYVSNALKAEGQSVVSPFTKKFLLTPIFVSGTSAGTGSSAVISFNITLPAESYTYLDGWYYASLVMYDSAGQQFVLKQKYIDFSFS